MSTKHTPGPWYVAIDDRYSMSHIDVRHTNDSPGAASGVIAKVTCRVSWAKEQSANARLIAAAPDLLGACVAEQLALVYDSDPGSNEANEAIKKLLSLGYAEDGDLTPSEFASGLRRSAIAKATGEQA